MIFQYYLRWCVAPKLCSSPLFKPKQQRIKSIFLWWHRDFVGLNQLFVLLSKYTINMSLEILKWLWKALAFFYLNQLVWISNIQRVPVIGNFSFISVNIYKCLSKKNQGDIFTFCSFSRCCPMTWCRQWLVPNKSTYHQSLKP